MEILLILCVLVLIATLPLRWMRRRHLNKLARAHGWHSWVHARRELAIRRSSSQRRKEEAIRMHGRRGPRR